MSFDFDGKPAKIHSVKIERTGTREYVLAHGVVGGEPILVDLTPPAFSAGSFTHGAATPIGLSIINTRDKTLFQRRDADAMVLTLEQTAVGFRGTFGGTVSDASGGKHAVTTGRFDAARTRSNDGAVTTVGFKMNGEPIDGLKGVFEAVLDPMRGKRFRFQGRVNTKPTETVSLILHLPSLERGVYAFPGVNLEALVIHVFDVPRMTVTDMYWLNSPIPTTRPTSPDDRMKVTITSLPDGGAQGVFEGRIHTRDMKKEIAITEGRIRFGAGGAGR